MKDPEKIRSEVSRAYEKALLESRSVGGGGCASDGCCSPPSGGVAAEWAGYDSAIAEHPEAGASSFGCGNPLAFAEVRPGQTVVDLGSGAGLDLLIAAGKVGDAGKVIGIDMTDAMIEAARANAAKAGFGNIEVRKGIIEDLPLEAGSADWVISNCVINLSPEKDLVFREIHRVLAPGGRFSISDIVAEDLPPELLTIAAAYSACVSGAISEGAYLTGLRRAGLTDLEVSERQVYTGEEIRAIVASELPGGAGILTLLDGLLAKLDGKVASVRVTGRKPEEGEG